MTGKSIYKKWEHLVFNVYIIASNVAKVNSWWFYKDWSYRTFNKDYKVALK